MSAGKTVIHRDIGNLGAAEAALSGTPPDKMVELWSPPNAAGTQGILWFVAMQDALRHRCRDRPFTLVVDCGGRADLAIEALRAGLPAVALAARSPVADKVVDIADQLGGRVVLIPAG
ncbi:hypothetical protein [Dongia mobilis]|uniref:hypothetical protein n=1 Tax=Dongia mobilis TaxID=578943 RepID=UPI00105BBD68|nr:hypothetical protein [Dongia mobilis]